MFIRVNSIEIEGIQLKIVVFCYYYILQNQQIWFCKTTRLECSRGSTVKTIPWLEIYWNNTISIALKWFCKMNKSYSPT